MVHGWEGKGVYSNIMSAVLGTKKESVFTFSHCEPFTNSEISQTHIAHCKSGNIAWEEVENV